MDTVPWELLYPIDGGNDNGFLVEQFPVVRRVYGQSRARHLSLASAAYVVPPGSPANAMDEIEIVKARLGAAVRHGEVCVDWTRCRILETHRARSTSRATTSSQARQAQSSVWTAAHFAQATWHRPGRQAAWRAQVRWCSSTPAVLGRDPGLMEMMGWARQFMGAGAGAFIGSLWAVRSSSAKAFADTFYQALVSEAAPLGKPHYGPD